MSRAHTRGRHHRLIPSRRWPRRTLVASNVLVALCLLSAGGIYGYVHYRLDQIHTQSAKHLTGGAGKGGSENILLIGNQSRACFETEDQSQAKGVVPQGGSPAELAGSLSDVIMILHINPSSDSGSILSIPRDTVVPVPAGSGGSTPFQKIDAALNSGANGPDNLIQAIQNAFGIPINHYVELNFCGFEAIVNAIGGIKVDFPEKLYDSESGLNVTSTGCQTVTGTEALALVRSRELQYDPPGDTEPKQDWPKDPESDLSRIVRDHEFLKILFATAISKGLADPITANDFLGAIASDITLDPGLKGQLVNLALQYSHLNPNSIPETTIPITTVSNYTYDGADLGDVDFPVQPLDNQVIAKWDSSALPDPSIPTVVNVVNAAGTNGLAAEIASGLAAYGLHTQVDGDSSVLGTPSETYVEYPPSPAGTPWPAPGLAQAATVAQHLGGAVVLEADSSITPGTVTVDAGSLLEVLPPASTTTTTTTPPASTAPGSSTPTTSTTTTTVPTPNGEAPSSSTDHVTPYDPIACPPPKTAKSS